MAINEKNVLRMGNSLNRVYILMAKRYLRQLLKIFLITLGLMACSKQDSSKGRIGFVNDGIGGVVADEPSSARIGRDILSSGGNAVDAVVAIYFAMAVTNPASATLGGGGVCVVQKGGKGDVAAIDFRPKMYNYGKKRVMIPGSVRGFFALHARFGLLKWETLLFPAEHLARFGNRVPRAFAEVLSSIPKKFFISAEVKKRFYPQGVPLAEGKMLKQSELASTLGIIRSSGPVEFYNGRIARQLQEYFVRELGVRVSLGVVSSFRPIWSDPVTIRVGTNFIHFPGGEIGKEAETRWKDIDKPTPMIGSRKLLAESAAFAAVDRYGGAAACVVTANGPLGAGNIDSSTGILMASSPMEAFPGIPVIYVNKPLGETMGVVTGTGESRRAIKIAKEVFYRKKEFTEVITHQNNNKNGKVNFIYCPNGARQEGDTCRFSADPSGFGIALGAKS